MKAKHGLWPVVRIKEHLEQKGMTQKVLAELIGETPQQVNKWVMGVEPCLNAIGRMALVLGVTLHDMVWIKGDYETFAQGDTLFVRGDILDNINTPEALLATLKAYYRWTDTECAGVEVVALSPTEAVLRCNTQPIVDWAKKDRDYIYRL